MASGIQNADASAQPPLLEPLPLDLAARVRALFQGAGYREEELVRVLGVEDPPLVTDDDAALRERTREPTPFNLLVRLFLLGHSLEAGLARRVLAEWFVAAAIRAGLLEDAQGQLSPRALVVPSGGALLASDRLDRLRSERGDHVPSGGPAARHLRNFTLRRPVASCLDLGTGNGVQALAAARHARRVVATDLNPRALDFARFNARLNGFEQIECRLGDGFAPVAGERFDLIVCNPPFVVTPSARFLYRDNDMELDGFCRRLVREAPAHLAEGGVFQMIFEWVQLADQAWEERLLGWFEGSGCDVWLVKANTHLPESYARRRLDETARATGDGAAAGLGEWLDYYRERKVVALHGGFLALRRRAGGGWHRLDQLTGDVDASFGAAIGRGFAARDFLAAHGDRESLLASRLRLADGVGVEKRARWEGGGWRTSARLSLEGFAWSVEVDPAMADFLVHFDGARGLAELCQAVVSELGVAEEGVLGFVRSLLDRGLLVP